MQVHLITIWKPYPFDYNFSFSFKLPRNSFGVFLPSICKCLRLQSWTQDWLKFCNICCLLFQFLCPIDWLLVDPFIFWLVNLNQSLSIEWLFRIISNFAKASVTGHNFYFEICYLKLVNNASLFF